MIHPLSLATAYTPLTPTAKESCVVPTESCPPSEGPSFFFFFFFEPILFWNTSQRLSPVVTKSHYICETYGKQRLPQISPSPHHWRKVITLGKASILVVLVK
jgi:hypothetical protein